MAQGSLFEIDPDPEPPPVAPPAPKPTPPKRLSPEEQAVIWERMTAVLVSHHPTLSRLRLAASHYFRAISAGKTFNRRPAYKVTIPAPSPLPDAPEARLMIQPYSHAEGRGALRSATVNADFITLTLCHMKTTPKGEEWGERLGIALSPPPAPPRVKRWYPADCDVDVERACQAAARFVADPPAAVAASGPNCAFCGRALTDPESRARGIGPECFGRFGDFVRFIAPAPEAN